MQQKKPRILSTILLNTTEFESLPRWKAQQENYLLSSAQL